MSVVGDNHVMAETGSNRVLDCFYYTLLALILRLFTCSGKLQDSMGICKHDRDSDLTL